MSIFLVDTDILSHYFHHHPLVIQGMIRRISHTLATSIITVQEVVAGWNSAISNAKSSDQAVVAYDHLTTALNLLQGWKIETISAAAMRRYETLRRSKLNVRKNDLRIAAIALEMNAVVVTRNMRDFQQVPGLMCENWMSPIP